ncbi:hypothetical protein OC845_005302 [Tilletia horrida]|nr:hypothetical protein OC845_005302 [Tilletia horrida]
MSSAVLNNVECELITLTPSSSTQADSLAVLTARSTQLEDVLSSPLALILLAPFAQDLLSSQSPTDFSKVEMPSLEESQHIDTLSIAIASLHAFIQLNWTGPDIQLTSAQAILKALPNEQQTPAQIEDKLRHAALDALTWAGEPAYHLCRDPFYLLFALKLLDSLLAAASTLASAPWWRLRAATVHSHILDEPVPYGSDILNPVDSLLSRLSADAASNPSKKLAQHLHALLILERGLATQRMGKEKEAAEQFVQAAKAHSFPYQLSGALGKRTKFQKEEKVQLILLAESDATSYDAQLYARNKGEEDNSNGRSADGEVVEQKEESTSKSQEEDLSQQNPANWGWQTAPDPEQDPNMPSTYLLNDDTLLEQTAFTSSTSSPAVAADSGTNASPLAHIDPANQPALFPLDQSILLALSLSVRNTSPSNGLTASEISAFVARVLPDPRNWSVHTMALLLRSRLESSRTRTVERSVLQLQALIDQMPTSDSSARERLAYFHALELPSRWEMQSELAKRYASIGVTRSALEIFERIEMWEQVVQCLGSLGRQEEAIEVVRDLLEGKKVEPDLDISRRRQQHQDGSSAADTKRLPYAREAKLWCLLGDVEPLKAREHYEQAWQVSRHSSPRAARSLGGYYFARQDYVQSAHWLKAALRTNPLYSRSWFILGCALMRLENWADAAIAFGRCVALVEDDGESWNNLASCYLRMGESAADRMDRAQDAAEEDGDVHFVGDDEDARSEQSFVTDSAIEMSGRADGYPMSTPGLPHRSMHERADARAVTGGPATPYRLRLLAHKALQHATRYSNDSWRVWANFMFVSVDAGMMGDACRALGKTVELRSKGAKNEREKADAVDYDVLDRLVDVVTRADSSEQANGEDAATAAATPAAVSPHEGVGLQRAVENLFENVLLNRISTSARIWRTYAKLLMWKRNYEGCLAAHMEAYRHSAGRTEDEVSASSDGASSTPAGRLAKWREDVQEVEDLVDLMENLGTRTRPVEASEGGGEKEKEIMPDWKFKARSLVRLFMGRHKELYSEEAEWERLVELRERLRSSAQPGYIGVSSPPTSSLSNELNLRCTVLTASGIKSVSGAFRKLDLCLEHGLEPRDLRKVDSRIPNVVPTILARRQAFLVNILHIRALIKSDKVFLFDSYGSSDTALHSAFVYNLEHNLRAPPSSNKLPFEFRALETALSSALDALRSELYLTSDMVHHLLESLDNRINRENLSMLLQYSRKVNTFLRRAQSVKAAAAEVLENDDDMALMYLTDSQQRSHPRDPAKDGVEELELLLESFDKQVEEVVYEAENMSSNIQNTQEVVELILDSNRNDLLNLDLRTSLTTLAVSSGTLLSGIFGMNLVSHFESHPFAFYAVSGMVGCVTLTVMALGWRLLAKLRRVGLHHKSSTWWWGGTGVGTGTSGSAKALAGGDVMAIANAHAQAQERVRARIDAKIQAKLAASAASEASAKTSAAARASSSASSSASSQSEPMHDFFASNTGAEAQDSPTGSSTSTWSAGKKASDTVGTSKSDASASGAAPPNGDKEQSRKQKEEKIAAAVAARVKKESGPI